jgi:hypothetical protein
MQLTVEAPINSLSFGNVSYNFLRQFWRRNVDLSLFTIGNTDLSAFDRIDPEFSKYIEEAIQNANEKLNKETPVFKMWHLNGSQTRVGEKQLLYTFYELDEPTQSEVNLANFQTKTIFSSAYSSDKFKEKGVDCDNIGIGFDEDLFKTNKKYLSDDVVHFGLMGKFEKRKHTESILKLWLSKYGNNKKYQLTVCVTNPFIKPEDMNQIIGNVLEGKRYTNINFLPYLKTNSEVNELLNAIDIDLTGLSGAEGWNLPSFNATCLGKWSIVLNATSHKDWATKENSILVEPNGKTECYDGHFFQKGAPFNQGNIYTWDRDVVSQAMDEAVSKKGQNNTKGEDLKSEFSYEKATDRIVTELQAL